MKKKVLLFLIFFTFTSWVFARGNTEDAETKTPKETWLLCITSFNSDSLPENKKIIADSIAKNMVESLNTINYRTRISPEYAFYESAAWAKARSDAAKALAQKQNERSLLLYRGDPGWRYRRNIERIEADIVKLQSAFEEAETNIPLVDSEPVFELVKINYDYEFPAAPKAGNEYRFCIDQKADAMLTGSIIEFHDRYIVSWKLYTVYTRSFIWEDSIIFSHNDLEKAMEEIMIRLIIALSGNEPAVLTVRTEPEDTLVLINRSFAGRGEIHDLEYPPGVITITASAPDHESLTFDAQLFPGEYTDINIRLWPIEFGDVEIDVFTSGNIYHGALYIGEAPLTLRLPLNHMEYIEFISPDNSFSSIVFQMPEESDFFNSIFMRAKAPPPKGRVDSSRRMYYWAWGGTWIAGITAWLAYQTYINSNAAISYDFNQKNSYNENFYNRNVNTYNLSMGAFIALGTAVLFDIILMSRYLYVANRGSAPVSRTVNK